MYNDQTKKIPKIQSFNERSAFIYTYISVHIDILTERNMQNTYQKRVHIITF